MSAYLTAPTISTNWWAEKAPGEMLTWSENIGPYVLATDVIAQVEASIAPSGAGELTIAAVNAIGQTLYLTLLGGQPRQIYTVSFVVATAAGAVYEPILKIGVRAVLRTDQPQTPPSAGSGLVALWPPYYTGLTASAGTVAVIDSAGWPTSPTGLPAGAVWLDSGIANAVTPVTAVPAQPVFIGCLRSIDLLAIGASGLPQYDPQLANQIWLNGSVLTVSAGSVTGLSSVGVVATVVDTVGWPTSPSGLQPGALWLNGAWINVVPGYTPNVIAPVFAAFLTSAQLLAYGGSILPTTDPGVAGQYWINGVVVQISQG